MKRGEIWWADLPKPAGRRPVVLLSRDKAIEVREFVIVAEITRTVRHIPVEIPLGREDGLPANCVINVDVINTISKKLLIQHISSLSFLKLTALDEALKFALNLS